MVYIWYNIYYVERTLFLDSFHHIRTCFLSTHVHDHCRYSYELEITCCCERRNTNVRVVFICDVVTTA